MTAYRKLLPSNTHSSKSWGNTLANHIPFEGNRFCYFFVIFSLWLNCVNLSNVFTLWKASQFTCQQFKGDCIFFCQTDYKLYLHTVIFYAKYLWSSFPQSRSTEMIKKPSIIFNYRFSVNHYTFSVFQCERLCGITRGPGCEVPGSISSLPSMDLRLLSSNALIRPALLLQKR